ncbi:hypothetical protein IWW50_005848 [Coemansia erecta]|nr:hypothetical protein IWW50_005848 [Coemansia erecta]
MPSVNVDWQHYSAAFVTPSLQSSGSPSTAFKTIGPDTLSAPSPQSVQSPQLGLHAQEQCNSEMSASSHRAHLGQMFPLAESQSAHASWLPDAASASAHCPDVNPLSQYGDVTGSAHSVVLARTPIETPTPDEQLAAACASTREASPSTATCGGRRRARGLQKASQSASMVFSPEAQRALQEVLIRIQKHPYPDPPTIRQLEEKYGLSTKQVRNWFALRRFRHMYTTEHEGIKIWHFRRNAL